MPRPALLALIPAVLLLMGACEANDAPDGQVADETDDESDGGDGDPTQLRMAHGAPPTHPLHECGFQPMAETISQRTDGAIEIEIFPQEELGSELEVLDSVSVGTIDLALFTAGNLAESYEPFGVLNAAYLFEDVDSMFEIVRGDIGQGLADGLEEEGGLHLLEVFYGGERHVTTSDVPARTPEDLDGVRMRIAEAPLWEANAEVLGATPTPLAAGEIYTGLQQGVVDAAEFPITGIDAFGFDEVQDYLILTGHVVMASPVAMNVDSWDALSPEQQDIFAEAAREAVEQARQCEEEREQDALDRWEEGGGLEIIDDVEVESFRQRASDILVPEFDEEWDGLYTQIRAAQGLE